jgi:hypothetical protein
MGDKSMYPIYLVHELTDGCAPETPQPFRWADPMFQCRGSELEPADHRISFQAWTDGDRFVLSLTDQAADDLQPHGVLELFFDRDFTRRKNHNMIVFQIAPDGGLVYQEFRYELETLDVPDGVYYQYETDGETRRVRLSIPLTLLRVHTPEQRTLGFNAVRAVGPDRHAAWSGLKGDKPQLGQGTGILLLTRGLAPEAFRALAERIGREENTYFTRWVKRKVPEEIRGLVREKTKGLTIRMNEEDVRRARYNAEHTEWGRAMKRDILRIADYWAAYSDDELFDLVPVGNPRAFQPSVHLGDPLTGGKRVFHVCLERPYQYYNPNTGMWWYNGMTLRNPTTGEELVLEDNGEGFLAPDGFPHPGVRYMFTATYRSFILSMLMGEPWCPVLEDRNVCPETSGKQYAGAICNLAYAYVLTGDRKYAWKALILIGRIAELVPYMNGNYNQYDTVQIAEPTTSESHWLSNFFDALDLLYDVIDELNPALAELFARKPDAENKARKEPFQLKKAVHEMIPPIPYSCEIEKRRSADWSLRWIYLELILAGFMQNGELMRRILYEGKSSLMYKMRNSFFRDGRYIYDSFFYIHHICEQMAMMANNVYRFRDETHFPDGIDLFEDARFVFKPVIELYFKLKCGNLTPMFGDFRGVNNDEPISEDRAAGKFEYHPSFEIAYRRMPSLRPIIGTVLAQYERDELYEYRRKFVSTRPQKHALLLLAAAGDWEEYAAYRANAAAIQPSYLMQDSETSVFRTGTNPHNCKHVILYGQPTAGHAHGDKLGLWIGAYGYNLMTGVGDYPYTWVSPKWHAWDEHSAACAVVIVDGRNQQPSYSRLKCHYEGRLLQLSGMENTTAYPGTHVERWICVVQAPNREDAYVVDLNYLAGGGTFDYNTIGLGLTLDDIPIEGVAAESWTPMRGTLAGEEVPLYSEPGYGWMRAVKKAKLNGPAAWTFGYRGAGMKIHALPDGESRELVCSLGEHGGQEPGKSSWEPFLMWRDTAADRDAHAATFCTVLEPYEHAAFLSAVRRLDLVDCRMSGSFKPAGIELVYRDGRWKDVVIANYGAGDQVRCRDSEGTEYCTDARMLLLRFERGELHAVEAVGYTDIRVEGGRFSSGGVHLTAPQAYHRGVVAGADLETRTIRVDLTHCDDRFETQTAGMAALIDSPDYLKPSAYMMRNPQLAGNRLTFESEMSLILMDIDSPFPHKRRILGTKRLVEYQGGQVYVDVKPGDAFTLPNSLKLTY